LNHSCCRAPMKASDGAVDPPQQELSFEPSMASRTTKNSSKYSRNDSTISLPIHQSTVVLQWDSALFRRVLSLLVQSMIQMNRLGNAVRLLHHLLSLVSYSRNDSTISLRFVQPTVVSQWDSAVFRRVFSLSVSLAVVSKAFVEADRWLYWSLSLVRHSRSDSTISLHFGGFAVFSNEILRFLSGYLVFGSDQRLIENSYRFGLMVVLVASIGLLQQELFNYLIRFWRSTILFKWDSAVTRGIFGPSKRSAIHSKALIYADHWPQWSLPLVRCSRNDSTISFDFGALPCFSSEMVL